MTICSGVFSAAMAATPSSRCLPTPARRVVGGSSAARSNLQATGLAPEPLWYDRYPHGLPRQILVYLWSEGEALTLVDPHHRIAHAAAVARVHGADSDEVQRFSPHPFNLLTFWQIWQAGEVLLREWVTSCSRAFIVRVSRYALDGCTPTDGCRAASTWRDGAFTRPWRIDGRKCSDSQRPGFAGGLGVFRVGRPRPGNRSLSLLWGRRMARRRPR